MSHPAVFQPLQARFLSIPQTPLCYWLRERFFELLAGRTLGDVADVPCGPSLGDTSRFVRFQWEVTDQAFAKDFEHKRWVRFDKGGGYHRWSGLELWVVDWEKRGVRVKNAGLPGTFIRNERFFFGRGWVYSSLASGSLGLRLAQTGLWGSVMAAPVIPREKVYAPIGALGNSRLATAAVRWLRPQIVLSEDYVCRVPLPAYIPDSLVGLEGACVALKRHLVALDPTERTFVDRPLTGATLGDAWRLATEDAEAVAAVLHTLEGIAEREVFLAYDIAGEDLRAVLDETGTPAGWFPLIAGYDAVPPLPEGLALDALLLEPPAHERRSTVPSEALADLKRRLRALYGAGPGAKAEEEENVGKGDENDEDNEAAGSGARIPVPAETFVEALSQKLEVHPISVCWLLKELRNQDGVVCLPELRRYLEDYLSVMLLHLLGHRWPRQMAAGEPVPEWADPDGIIPLSEGAGVRTLLDRVRERIGAGLGAKRVDAIEQEFRIVIGGSLSEWLARDFFPRHVSQFRRRPVAWLLESGHSLETRWDAAQGGKRGRRTVRAGGPAFSCLVYCHKMTADTLSRIKTHYLRPVLQRREFELAEERRRAAAGNSAARASAERLAEMVDELRAFESALDTVAAKGFLSQRLQQLLAKEEADQWALRTPQSPVPDREAFLRQEQAYDPDINDGVRVNIAPLQKYGLLAAGVLAPKDVEEAIADRAKWRFDERRWCREGKLPKPGWWE